MSELEGRGRAYADHIHKDIIGTSIGSWDKMVNELGNLAWSMIDHAAQEIVDSIGGVIKQIFDAGAVIWDTLATTVQNMINNASAWIGTIIETIKNAGAVAWNHLSAALQSTINNASAWIGTIIENIKNTGAVAWNHLATAVQNTINNAAAWLGTIIETIKNAGIVAWGQVTHTVTDILNVIANWANMVTQFGKFNGGDIQDLSITNAQIANATITAAKIANATITAAQIANATITAAQIANATITSAQIANATITGANIANATITDAHITSLDAGKISTGYLSASRLNTSVAYITTSAMIANATIDNVHIKSGVIGFDKTNTSFSKDSYLDKTSILVGVDALLAYTTYGYSTSTGGSFTLKKAYIKAQSNNGTSWIWGYKVVDATLNPICKFKIKPSGIASAYDRIQVGLRQIDDSGYTYNIGAWIRFEQQSDGTNMIKAYSGNTAGSGAAVNLTTFTNGTEYVVVIKVNSGSSIQYYINGTLYGTITTYIPAETLCDFYLEVAPIGSNLVVAEVRKWKLTDDW